MKAGRRRREIAADLVRHLEGDGTLNDSETGRLYREWHGTPEDEDLDLEEVERWAVGTASR